MKKLLRRVTVNIHVIIKVLPFYFLFTLFWIQFIPYNYLKNTRGAS